MIGSEVSTSVMKCSKGVSYRVSIIIIRYRHHTSLVNKANSVHNLFLVHLFLAYLQSLHVSGVYVSIIRRNNRIYATLGTCYSVWMTVWYAGLNAYPANKSSTQNNKYHVSQRYSCFSWWWAHSRPKRVEIDKYTKNKLCTKLALFTRLYKDARSIKHKRQFEIWCVHGFNFCVSMHHYICVY